MDDHDRAVEKLEEILAEAMAGRTQLSMASVTGRPDRPEGEKLYYIRVTPTEKNPCPPST